MSDLWSLSIIFSLIIILSAIGAGIFFGVFFPPTRIFYDKEKDIKKISIKNIDRMDRSGKQFEHYLCVLLTAIGYTNTYKTKDTSDFGADLVFTNGSGERTVVQAKNYAKNNKIGNDAVQQVYSAMPFYKATKGIIITSSSMTKQCETQASACNVTIIARSDLIKIIELFKKGLYNEVKKIIERDSRFVDYTPKDRLVNPQITKSMVKSGGYFYKIPIQTKKTS